MRRTGREGLHERVVEDKRARAEGSAARRDVADALLQHPTRRITERALLGRVRRKLAHGGEVLVVTRPGSQLAGRLGRYLVCDARSGNPRCSGDVSALVQWARELGVIHSDEVLK
jgi:hypothetical protein